MDRKRVHHEAFGQPPHPTMLYEEHRRQSDEIRRLRCENEVLVGDKVILVRQLDSVKLQLETKHLAVMDLRFQQEVHSNDLIARCLKLEAELHERKMAEERLKEEIDGLRTAPTRAQKRSYR